MKKCNYCGKTLEDDRFDYCNIDCRKAERLSSERQRNKTPLRLQDLNYNSKNYEIASARLIAQHKELGHLVNVK